MQFAIPYIPSVQMLTFYRRKMAMGMESLQMCVRAYIVYLHNMGVL